MSRAAPASQEEADKLELYAVNEHDIYRQRQAIEENLKKWICKGVYDPELAAKAWTHWMNSAAKHYKKEGFWRDTKTQFTPATRALAARSMEKAQRAELKLEAKSMKACKRKGK